MKCLHYLLLFITILCTSNGYSQYYYNDIVTMQQSQKQYIALRANAIMHVTATSYESNNQPAENFKLEQEISKDARTITITSGYPSAGDVITVNTYNNRKLVQTKDSSANVVTVTTYKYETNGKISSISTRSDDAFMNSHSTELHQWIYNAGQPVQMLKIKDNRDTTIVDFVYDDGNIVQETWRRKGTVTENYYYYYDTKNQLTDIVRYNMRAKKMLPDYVYQYDAEGRVVQMMQVPTGGSDYMIWKYAYNSNGLKEKEWLYNKQQQLIGRIEYKYDL